MQGAYHAFVELTRVSERGILLAILSSRVYGLKFIIHAVSKGFSWHSTLCFYPISLVAAEEKG